ncbi:MAG TPA: hypothetical protein VGI46_03475 [Candidatus Acidoferrum sp.]|jgi:hypothetical protein
MRKGSDTFKDAAAIPDGRTGIFDWLNLPPGADPVSLWDCLHDADVVSIRSNLLERTMSLFCDIEHLRSFHQLDEGFQFILRLEGVQSARVLRYEIWPGGCSIPPGASREEESRLVAEYQAKWREQSASWEDFEAVVTRQDEQVFDISDAAVATSQTTLVALRLCGHLNYATYHEVYLRAERLNIFGSDGREFTLGEFQKLGETYWEAFSRRTKSNG